MTPLEQASKHVTTICKALNLRDDCEYDAILTATALQLLRKREEELRYSALFGNNEEKLAEVGEKLVPIFESAWTRQKSPAPISVHDDPDELITIATECRGLVKLGNAGCFRDPQYKLVVVLNKFIMHIDERARLLMQIKSLRLA